MIDFQLKLLSFDRRFVKECFTSSNTPAINESCERFPVFPHAVCPPIE